MKTRNKFPLYSVYALIVALSLFAGLGALAFAPATPPAQTLALADGAQPQVGDLWGRTELYFGSAKPDSSRVLEIEFRAFVDKEITPRFPDGLTLLSGYGQYKGADGKIAKEQSFVLVLLYPKLDRETNARLEAIRAAYKKAFHQESVLRVDGAARVSF